MRFFYKKVSKKEYDNQMQKIDERIDDIQTKMMRHNRILKYSKPNEVVVRTDQAIEVKNQLRGEYQVNRILFVYDNDIEYQITLSELTDWDIKDFSYKTEDGLLMFTCLANKDARRTYYKCVFAVNYIKGTYVMGECEEVEDIT